MSIRSRRLSVERLENRIAMCAPAAAMQPATALTAYEQQMLEQINQVRSNPAAEAARLGINLNQDLDPGTLGTHSRQPLAPGALLDRVADGHTDDMLSRGFFAHKNPDGLGPVERAAAASYYTSYVGENLSARGGQTEATGAKVLHDSLFLSAGHRVNTLLDGYREAGIGLKTGRITFTSGRVQQGAIVTQVFGGGYPGAIYVTGVAFDDATPNGSYDAGEGRGGIRIEARGETGDRFSTITGSSGGYSLRLVPGMYQLFAYASDEPRMIELGDVELGSSNIKKDVDVQRFNRGAVVSDEIMLAGADKTLSLADPNVNLADVCRIDIRGAGDNQLLIDSLRLSRYAGDRVLAIHADHGDDVLFDEGWTLGGAVVDGGQLRRRLEHGTTQIDLIGPDDLTNPIDAFDVDASGAVSSLDALAIINELSARRFSSQDSGQTRIIGNEHLDRLMYVDVSRDGFVTSLDALRVINEASRRYNSFGETEYVVIAYQLSTEKDRSEVEDSVGPAGARPVSQEVFSRHAVDGTDRWLSERDGRLDAGLGNVRWIDAADDKTESSAVAELLESSPHRTLGTTAGHSSE